MEIHVRLGSPLPELAMLENAITALDPAAVVDVDAAAGLLRVNAAVDAAQLVALASQAGYVLAPDDVMQQPSVCCGGCSG